MKKTPKLYTPFSISLRNIILAVLLLALAGCTTLPPAYQPTPAVDPQAQIATLVASALPPTPEPVEASPQPASTEDSPTPAPAATLDPNINPLTGLPAPNPVLLERRPVMVKVSNYPVVGRPHAGLSFADIVFEYYIGEYINRFLAIFYSQDAPTIGPVRSGRLVDIQLVRMYQGMMAYGDADERVDEPIKEYLGLRALAHNESPCPPICGFDPHSAAGTFADSASLTRYFTNIGVDNDRQPLEGMRFDPNPPAEGQPAVQLGVEYAVLNRGEWRYDPDSGKYRRWIEEMDEDDNRTMIPLVDRLTNEQLQFSNVIVLYTFYVEYNRTLHNIDIWNNSGSQQALFFRDGLLNEGTWKMVDKERPIQFFDARGEPYKLKPGNTWVVLAGLSSTFSQPQPGQWEFYFYLP